MGIRFRCHHCEKKLNIKRELAGRRGICPACQGRFRIPLQDCEFSGDVSESWIASETALSQSVGLALTQKTATATSSTKPLTESSLYLVKPPSGGVYGPADLMTIEGWVAEHRITADTVIAPVGSNRWQSAGEYFPDAFES